MQQQQQYLKEGSNTCFPLEYFFTIIGRKLNNFLKYNAYTMKP